MLGSQGQQRRVALRIQNHEDGTSTVFAPVGTTLVVDGIFTRLATIPNELLTEFLDDVRVIEMPEDVC